MSTKNEKEVENFNALANDWWDERGPMRPLHMLNPVRIEYIKNQICAHFNLDPDSDLPLKGLKILDVGCGGGIVCEPLSRLGANVTGLDAAKNNIKIAKEHAKEQKLRITYKDDLVENHQGQYDVVLALEIIEHVDQVDFFLKSCEQRLKKNGLIIISTLNRNAKSFALGIIAAEYLLKWVPKGTHDWKKFKKPSEVSKLVEQLPLKIRDVTGLVYNPFKKSFALSKTDLDVNYFISFVKR